MSPTEAFWLAAIVCCCLFDLSIAQMKQPPPPSPSSRTLAPCQACRVFAASFADGMKRTERGKFEGGDAAWEEEKLGKYARSEVRLVEIQEKLCTELKEHKERCHSLAETAEHFIEEWWFGGVDSAENDIFNFLCVEKLKHCCPPRRYGENCSPCKGIDAGSAEMCGGNGRCKGDGTRKGNGECACDPGYRGDRCDSCSPGYYESYRDTSKTICSPCHRSCKGECVKAGYGGCTACNPGWTFLTDRGCMDVDECATGSASPCSRNQFCINEEGSFKCLECDRSCDGCHGDGPDMCRKCAVGYQFKDKLCVGSEGEKLTQRVTVTRYLTYLGLCVTICIIFQKSTVLAGALGLLVALYISVSEYMLADDTRGPTPMIDPSDIAKLFSKGI